MSSSASTDPAGGGQRPQAGAQRSKSGQGSQPGQGFEPQEARTGRDGRFQSKRPSSAEAVSCVAQADLSELYRFWSGGQSSKELGGDEEVRERVLGWMSDPQVVVTRIAELGKRLATILDLHLDAPRYQCSITELMNSRPLAYLSSYDLEASLTVLERNGLLVSSVSNGMVDYGAKVTSLPCDIGDHILRQRRATRRGIFDVFTLRGHLDRLCNDPSRKGRTPPSRVREMYKMYSNEAAAVARIKRLPDGLRGMVEKTVLEFGGLLPRDLFERMDSNLPHWNGRRWGRILEESLIGTVERLELGNYGINHSDETLIVFNEVALAWLRRIAVPADPDAPAEEASLGVDLVSNITRFIGFIIDHAVRFTVRGEIFKTTEKRILQELIPNPGRELARSDVLDFIYSFARDLHLIESTGQRTFALTTQGREWEPQGLDFKLRRLLDYVLEERFTGAEYYHQVRMRRIFLRLLKRVEPGVWYDLMYVPFLARNTYLASLDELAVEDYFEARSQAGQYSPMEDLQRMAWNLVTWVRQRLYLLGIVDLGYNAAHRPVAMRLSTIGARLLGVVDTPTESASQLGNLVVTPDFEVVLFPTGDDAELVHELDRFCVREKFGHLFHFRITEKTVVLALTEGMFSGRILAALEQNSRTPVPQNVIFSVRDWSSRAGLLRLGENYVVRGDNLDVLRRFEKDPGVRPYIARSLGEQGVRLRDNLSLERTQGLLRELGFLVELEGE